MNLKKFRLQKGFTQKSLGEIIGTSRNTIARWEREEMTPKLENIKKY